MKRAWLGVLLLAGSWLFGLHYYRGANWYVWAALVIPAALCFLQERDAQPARRFQWWLAGFLGLPAVFVAPWPYRLVPLSFVAGTFLCVAPIPRRWPARVGAALVSVSVVALAQVLALLLYKSLTARNHDLPMFLARAMEWLARLVGLEAAYTGREIAIFTMRKVHQLAPTWELILDPVTVCFLVGGLALLLTHRGKVDRASVALVGIVLVWLPLRYVLMLGVFVHRALLTDYDAPLRLMNQFWNPWLLLGLCGVPVLVAIHLVPVHGASGALRATEGGGEWRRTVLALLLLSLGVGSFSLGLFWDPVGTRKDGRVLVDEFHSTWEPTTRPFDTTWYGHNSGYNYACIYDYCSRFYQMGRITNRIDDAALSECDVLMLKVPTSPYAAEEIAAILRFVRRGGGLLLIGEHTDVFLTSTHLNQIARRLGFEFRSDCLFGIESPFVQQYRPPPVPHAIVRNVPPLDFAVSCSIRPHRCSGRAVILDAGLWSLPADYHASNFYPQVEDRADTRYGAFIQLWAAREGKGRVVGFGDSTIFSNFSAFEPGKSELMLSMLEWLNHQSWGGDPRVLLIVTGIALGIAALLLRPRPLDGNMVLGIGFLVWTVSVGICRSSYLGMTLPRAVRPMTLVAIDRTVSQAPLSRSGFIQGTSKGFGIFEQWILRLGYFTTRRAGKEAFKSDVLVVFEPNLPLPGEFRDELVTYVKRGGKVLVLDSALNTSSTANSLLVPFGLILDRSTSLAGALETPEGWPSVPVTAACVVKGGEPLVMLEGKPVAAMAKCGEGIVVALGFGARFNDENMGVTTELEPSDDLRRVFELQFSLLRWLVAFSNQPRP